MYFIIVPDCARIFVQESQMKGIWPKGGLPAETEKCVKGFFKSNANNSLDMLNSILGYKLASKYNMQNRGYFFRVYRA